MNLSLLKPIFRIVASLTLLLCLVALSACHQLTKVNPPIPSGMAFHPLSKDDDVYEALILHAWKYPMDIEADNFRYTMRHMRLEECPPPKKREKYFISLPGGDPSEKFLTRLKNHGMNALPKSKYQEKDGVVIPILSEPRWVNENECKIDIGYSYNYTMRRVHTYWIFHQWETKLEGITYID